MTELPEAAGLDTAVDQELRNGGRLKSRIAGHAVVAYGGGSVLMHVTFAVLTMFTCGFFVFPWIVWANTNREHLVTLRVESDGTVHRT
jgi:hypothetical protein